MPENAVIHTPVFLSRPALRQMVELVRLLHELSQRPAYRALVYPLVPESARFDPGHDSVMMGYDFHLSDDGPRLIEVNTNAGGGLLACRAALPQGCSLPAELPTKLKSRLLQSFAAEFKAFTGDKRDKPQRIVIIDENPTAQFLYPEMAVFAKLFRAWGAKSDIVDPAQLRTSADGVTLSAEPVDMIYNRHCDFYLESAAMAGLRDAWLAHAVCLTPNPHTYGLLGDKRRLAIWSDAGLLKSIGLPTAARDLCLKVVPRARLLADFDRETVWAERKQLVFKPVALYGSKGVLLGEKISHKRFDELPPDETLVQTLVPPSMTETPGNGTMKTEFRLFAYRDRVLGVSARLYRGQVTNMRTPGGGFAPVVTS
jgi:hypothetical protein